MRIQVKRWRQAALTRTACRARRYIPHFELGCAYVAARDTARARAAFETGLALPSREKHDESAKTRARAALALLDGA